MLRIPWVITETVPEGPLTRDARTIKSLLTDQSRTGLVLVTLAEEMPTNEAVELSTALKSQLDMEVGHLVVNQVYPDRFAPGSPSRRVLQALSEPSVDPKLQAVATHSRLGMKRRALNEQYLEQLTSSIPGSRTELPMLFGRDMGLAEIEHLSLLLEHNLAT